MIYYAVIDADGYVVRVGRCNEPDLVAQAGEGETAVEIGARPVIRAGRRYRLSGDIVVEA